MARKTDMNDKSIFISYAHRDTDQVLPVIAALLEEGCNVWFDEGIEVGTEWPATIEKELKKSSLVIAFISEASVNSQNCRNEINYAVSLRKDILTIYLEETRLADGMNLQLGSLQAMFKYRHSSEKSFIGTLISSDIIKKNKPGYAESAASPKSAKLTASTEASHTADSSESDAIEEIKNAKLKSTVVKFGSYTSGGFAPTPIEWIVLDKQCGAALLITKYVIDCRDYGEEYLWSESEVRHWLNVDFYTNAFSRSEKKYILDTENYSEIVKYIGESRDTESTIDNVFLLDRSEIKRYFGAFGGKLLIGTPTPYAARRGAYIERKSCPWWLRSSHGIQQTFPNTNRKSSYYPKTRPGDTRRQLSFIAPVHPYHHLISGSRITALFRYYNSEKLLNGIGIRPAIWVRYE